MHAIFKLFPIECFWEKTFGIECPGCGMQRSFEYLIHGKWEESIRMYPPLIPLLIMLCFTAIHLVFNFKKGAVILKWMAIVNAVLITLNYIIKIS